MNGAGSLDAQCAVAYKNFDREREKCKALEAERDTLKANADHDYCVELERLRHAETTLQVDLRLAELTSEQLVRERDAARAELAELPTQEQVLEAMCEFRRAEIDDPRTDMAAVCIKILARCQRADAHGNP